MTSHIYNKLLDKGTLVHIIHTLTQENNAKNMYDEYNKLNKETEQIFFNDINFDIISLSNIVLLLINDKETKDIYEDYINDIKSKLCDLFCVDDYVFNIMQFLSEKDKLQLRLSDKEFNQKVHNLNSKLYPHISKINKEYIISNYSQIYDNYYNYDKVTRLKIKGEINKLKCTCKSTFQFMTLGCYSCNLKMLHIMDPNITYFKCDRRDPNLVKQLKIKKLNDTCDNLQKVLDKSNKEIMLFNEVYKKLAIKNVIILDYQNVIKHYAEQYGKLRREFDIFSGTEYKFTAINAAACA